MYKGKGTFGAEPIGEMRSKRVPKESRRTLGAHSHQQSKMDAYSGKNELSKYKMKVNGQLLDYITSLQEGIQQTDNLIKSQQKMFIDLLLNVSNFLGIKQVNKETILKQTAVDQTELVQNFEGTLPTQWFEFLQQYRFKQYLYGAGGDQKLSSRFTETVQEQHDEKRRTKKVYQPSSQVKKRKRPESKKPSQPQPLKPSEEPIQQEKQIQITLKSNNIVDNYMNLPQSIVELNHVKNDAVLKKVIENSDNVSKGQ